MRVVILVPHRSDEDRFDQSWDFTCNWLRRHHEEYPIYLGSPSGPFHRGAAISAAATAAGWWDVAVICDADTIVPPLQLETAVHEAHVTGLRVSAMTRVVDLSPTSTRQLLSDPIGTDLSGLPKIRARRRPDTSRYPVLAVPRTRWDALGLLPASTDRGRKDDAAGITATPCRTAAVDRRPLRVSGSAYRLRHEKFAANPFRLRHRVTATNDDHQAARADIHPLERNENQRSFDVPTTRAALRQPASPGLADPWVGAEVGRSSH